MLATSQIRSEPTTPDRWLAEQSIELNFGKGNNDMRNISFMLTTDQIRSRTKTVTRRTGWANLVPGQLLRGVGKDMGLKAGEKDKELAVIRVVSVRPE
jgi:hypothetical protein